MKFVRVKEKMEVNTQLSLIQDAEESFEDDRIRINVIRQSYLKQGKWNVHLRAPPVFQRIVGSNRVKPLSSLARVFRGLTTRMECYLASKERLLAGNANPWPGNLDAAVWDEKQKNFNAIIEFKTHNYPQYPISSQHFNQFPGDDRRYKALDIMQNHLGKMSKKPKFVYAIWGTDPSHTEVKLQTIDNLKASNDRLIKRPIFTNATTKEFTDEVIKYICS